MRKGSAQFEQRYGLKTSPTSFLFILLRSIDEFREWRTISSEAVLECPPVTRQSRISKEEFLECDKCRLTFDASGTRTIEPGLAMDVDGVGFSAGAACGS